jgi:hypothetical protein
MTKEDRNDKMGYGMIGEGGALPQKNLSSRACPGISCMSECEIPAYAGMTRWGHGMIRGWCITTKKPVIPGVSRDLMYVRM